MKPKGTKAIRFSAYSRGFERADGNVRQQMYREVTKLAGCSLGSESLRIVIRP
jgi:hypothetical protein